MSLTIEPVTAQSSRPQFLADSLAQARMQKMQPVQANNKAMAERSHDAWSSVTMVGGRPFYPGG